MAPNLIFESVSSNENVRRVGCARIFFILIRSCACLLLNVFGLRVFACLSVVVLLLLLFLFLLRYVFFLFFSPFFLFSVRAFLLF